MPKETDSIITRVDRARLLLAEARDALSAKRVADLARAAEVYARRQRLADEAILSATAIKIDAMTLMGEFLTKAPKDAGGRPAKTGPQSGPVSRPPTLATVGITKNESSDAQALAGMRDTAPDLYDRVRAGEVSVAAARAQARPPVPAPDPGVLAADDRYADPECLALLDDLYALEGRVNGIGERLEKGGSKGLLKKLSAAVERVVDAAEAALSEQ